MRAIRIDVLHVCMCVIICMLHVCQNHGLALFEAADMWTAMCPINIFPNNTKSIISNCFLDKPLRNSFRFVYAYAYLYVRKYNNLE